MDLCQYFAGKQYAGFCNCGFYYAPWDYHRRCHGYRHLDRPFSAYRCGGERTGFESSGFAAGIYCAGEEVLADDNRQLIALPCAAGVYAEDSGDYLSDR